MLLPERTDHEGAQDSGLCSCDAMCGLVTICVVFHGAFPIETL